MDLTWICFIYLAVAVVCIPLGAVTLVYGIKPIDVSTRYDQTCFGPGFNASTASNSDRLNWIYNNSMNPSATTCTVTLSISQNMPAPIYLLYEINGFQQNHLRYVWSRSETQLVAQKSPDVSYCTAQLNYNDSSSQQINPCGLTAWTNFNDTYTPSVTRNNATAALPIQTSNIAPSSDTRYQFADYIPSQWYNPYINNLRGGDNITGYVKEDSQFVIWMKLAPLPKFRKLYAIITQDLQAGDTVSIQVFNVYNTFVFDGQKSVILSTTTWMGSNNPMLGICFLITGGVSIILGIIYFIVATRIAPRKPGDLSVLAKNPMWADFATM